MKTLYDLLGVPRHASLVELERAYRGYLEAHLRAGARTPGPRAQRRLRALREAFLLLASPARRASYDQQLALREERRARRLRNAATLACACLVVAGFALIGGAWYQTAASDSGSGDRTSLPTSQSRA